MTVQAMFIAEYDEIKIRTVMYVWVIEIHVCRRRTWDNSHFVDPKIEY